MESLYENVKEADVGNKDAMAATKQIASTYEAEVLNLGILDKLAMTQVTKTPAGSAKPGDFVVVFKSTDNLQEGVKGSIGCFMVSELYTPNASVGGDGVLLPLVPTGCMETGVRGPMSEVAKDVIGQTLVFENVDFVLKVKDDSMVHSALKKLAQQQGIKNGEKGTLIADEATQQAHKVEIKKHGVMNLDGVLYTSSEKAGLMSNMLAAVFVGRVMSSKKKMDILVLDGKLRPEKIREVLSLLGSASNETATGKVDAAFPKGRMLNAVVKTEAIENLDKFIQGEWADFHRDTRERHLLCLQSFTTHRILGEIQMGQSTLHIRQLISAALLGVLTTLEGLTCLNFTQCEVAKIANRLLWSDEFNDLEDLYLFSLFDQALYRWMSSVSTMRKEDIMGLTAPMDEDKPGQLWMRYLEHTVAEAVKNASPRPHYGFREANIYQNYLEAGRMLAVEATNKKAAGKGAKHVANEMNEGDQEQDSSDGEKDKTQKKRARRGCDDEPTICIKHLAGLFGLKDTRDRLYACSYGGSKCIFHHHECKKDAGTKSELLSIVENSRIANLTLRGALIEALKTATDLD